MRSCSPLQHLGASPSQATPWTLSSFPQSGRAPRPRRLGSGLPGGALSECIVYLSGVNASDSDLGTRMGDTSTRLEAMAPRVSCEPAWTEVALFLHWLVCECLCVRVCECVCA